MFATTLKFFQLKDKKWTACGEEISEHYDLELLNEHLLENVSLLHVEEKVQVQLTIGDKKVTFRLYRTKNGLYLTNSMGNHLTSLEEDITGLIPFLDNQRNALGKYHTIVKKLRRRQDLIQHLNYYYPEISVVDEKACIDHYLSKTKLQKLLYTCLLKEAGSKNLALITK